MEKEMTDKERLECYRCPYYKETGALAGETWEQTQKRGECKKRGVSFGWISNADMYYHSKYRCDRYAEEDLPNLRYREKNEVIRNAIEVLCTRGYRAVLKDPTNGCIRVFGRNGRAVTYYATTGTIAGYMNTPIEGIDGVIELLEAYAK